MTPSEVILRKNLVSSGLSSAEWTAMSAAVRDRAFFSSRVASVRFLETCRTRIAELLENKRSAGDAPSSPLTSRAQVVSDIMRAARESGISTGTGSITDPGSVARANVIIDTNAGMAAGYAAAEQANTFGARLAFPAQELIRIEQREVPRDWRGKWVSKGGKLYQGRMIALKDDPIWTAISRFGQPYPPFDFNSGMGVEAVSYDEAVELGVINDGYQPPEKSPLKAFNEGLEAEMKVGDGKRLGELRKIFGDQIRNDNGVIRWRQELIREAFNSNKPFVIRLGEATPEFLSRLPSSVPAQSCAGKSLTVDHTWLDRKRKDGTDHRAHFYPIEEHPEDVPLTVEDLELLPELWRRPDKIERVGKTRVMLSMKALDGSTYKAVVDYENRPYLNTFYKEGKKNGS